MSNGLKVQCSSTNARARKDPNRVTKTPAPPPGPVGPRGHQVTEAIIRPTHSRLRMVAKTGVFQEIRASIEQVWLHVRRATMRETNDGAKAFLEAAEHD